MIVLSALTDCSGSVHGAPIGSWTLVIEWHAWHWTCNKPAILSLKVLFPNLWRTNNQLTPIHINKSLLNSCVHLITLLLDLDFLTVTDASDCVLCTWTVNYTVVHCFSWHVYYMPTCLSCWRDFNLPCSSSYYSFYTAFVLFVWCDCQLAMCCYVFVAVTLPVFW